MECAAVEAITESLVNTGESSIWPSIWDAEVRVRVMQTKLHRWAIDDSDRCFDDLFNLVCDPAFLVVAWDRVRGNKGARSAGIDGVKPASIVFGSETLLSVLRDDLKAGLFVPAPVKEKMIPKANEKLRRLGIPTTRDRIVQAALKLVLEPIFEADCSCWGTEWTSHYFRGLCNLRILEPLRCLKHVRP